MKSYILFLALIFTKVTHGQINEYYLHYQNSDLVLVNLDDGSVICQETFDSPIVFSSILYSNDSLLFAVCEDFSIHYVNYRLVEENIRSLSFKNHAMPTFINDTLNLFISESDFVHDKLLIHKLDFETKKVIQTVEVSEYEPLNASSIGQSRNKNEWTFLTNIDNEFKSVVLDLDEKETKIFPIPIFPQETTSQQDIEERTISSPTDPMCRLFLKNCKENWSFENKKTDEPFVYEIQLVGPNTDKKFIGKEGVNIYNDRYVLERDIYSVKMFDLVLDDYLWELDLDF